MICYLIRHGKDDDSVRGGWSDSPLCAEGVRQIQQLSAEILSASDIDIEVIYSSDLPRAKQSAEILASSLSVDVIEMPGFRETNNGVLAGMDNRVASEKYPGLYWSALEWNEPYPEGESPCAFYNRISDTWHDFKAKACLEGRSMALVTHGGVINVIMCIENGIAYSNKANPFPVGHAQMIAIDI